MSKRAELDVLDAQIVNDVRAGHNRFRDIRVRFEGKWRYLDKRLQSLRKRGILTFSHQKGWTAP